MLKKVEIKVKASQYQDTRILSDQEGSYQEVLLQVEREDIGGDDKRERIGNEKSKCATTAVTDDLLVFFLWKFDQPSMQWDYLGDR